MSWNITDVLESKQRMRQLPIFTQTFLPDIAARWKMTKCTGCRLKCWIQTKIFIKYQHFKSNFVLFILLYFEVFFEVFFTLLRVVSKFYSCLRTLSLIFILFMIKFNFLYIRLFQSFSLGLGRTYCVVNVLAGELSKLPMVLVIPLDLVTHSVSGHPCVDDGQGHVVTVTPPAKCLLSISK